jgi:hypothetical protein
MYDGLRTRSCGILQVVTICVLPSNKILGCKYLCHNATYHVATYYTCFIVVKTSQALGVSGVHALQSTVCGKKNSLQEPHKVFATCCQTTLITNVHT